LGFLSRIKKDSPKLGEGEEAFYPTPAKIGEGREAFLPTPSLGGEGGRGDTASRNTTIIRDFYVRDFAANPDLGFLHSGLFRPGKVCGPLNIYINVHFKRPKQLYQTTLQTLKYPQ
jgi:hypothetical protein